MASRIDIRYIDFTTEGNAARKIAPAPKKKVQLPNAKRKSRYVLRIDPLALAGIVVASLMIVLMVSGMLRLHNAQEENRQMSLYVSSLSQQNTALREEFNQVCDLDEVQQLAMALGMVPKAEANTTGISMYVPEEAEAAPGFWERIGIFLAGLFA